MASVSPITEALTAPFQVVQTNTAAATQAAQTAAADAAQTAQAAQATEIAAQARQVETQQATQAATQAAAANAQAAAANASATTPINMVLDSLALDSAFNETLFTSTAVEGTGAYSVFMGELFAALSQQTQAAQAAAQANVTPATASAITPAAAAQPTATTAAVAVSPPATAATAEFASNATTTTPNSALESNVQALANTPQALTPLQQSFEQLVAGTGATASNNNLPAFLQALANNLHTVQSPLGNLVDSVT